MTKAQRQRALEILEEHPAAPAVWMNPRGNFFTDEIYANNSLKKGEKLEVVKRPKKTTPKPPKPPKEETTPKAGEESKENIETQTPEGETK